jgi:hypothetical protein
MEALEVFDGGPALLVHFATGKEIKIPFVDIYFQAFREDLGLDSLPQMG